MFATGKLLLLLLLAPPTVEDLTPLELARPDFYQALANGQKLEVAWSLSRPEVPLDGEATLELTIRHAANPTELQIPDLKRLLPELAQRLQLLPATTREILPDGTVQLRYPFRPLPPSGTVKIPGLKYVYYRLDFPPGLRFQTTYSRSVEVRITPAAERAIPSQPLQAPERFFEMRSVNPWPGPEFAGWCWWPLLLPLPLTPLIVMCWRGLFPDAARRAMLRRHRAARHAWQALRNARGQPEPTAQAWLILRDYLRARLELPEAAQTAAELLAALEGQPVEAVEATRQFFHRCELVRYASLTDSTVSLLAEAEELVVRWESALQANRGHSARPVGVGLLVLVVLLGASPPAASPGDAGALFLEGVALRANAVQAQERFRQAALAWQAEPLSVVSATNAGRAWYLAGELPLALRCVHDGLVLAPWDDELQQDLLTLRDMVNDPSVRPLSSPGVAAWLSPYDQLVASGILAGLITLALVWWLLSRDRLALLAASALVVLAVGLLVISMQSRLESRPPVRILTAPTLLRTGNGPNYPPRPAEPLPRGTELIPRHERGGWLLVELPDGTRGWLPANRLL